MKKILILMCFCIAQNVAFSQACQSVFSVLLNSFEDVLYEYQDFRKEAAAVIFNETIGDLAAMSIDFQTSLYDKAMIIPGNGSSSIGPRYIYVDMGANKATGDLVTDRTFIAVPSGFDKLFVTITKTNGKAGADIAACLKNDNGEMVNKKEKSIAKNSADGKSIEFTFFGTEDKYLTVHLVKTIGLNQFDYSIKVRGEMNPDKLEDELEEWKDENEDVMTSNPKENPTGAPKDRPDFKNTIDGKIIKIDRKTERNFDKLTPTTVNDLSTQTKQVSGSSARSATKKRSIEPSTQGEKLTEEQIRRRKAKKRRNKTGNRNE